MDFIKTIKTFAILLVATSLSAQTDDTVLMTVADKDVTVGEFRYIYEKNNGDGANYSPKSLNEYIDLYIKFKLKVAEAKAMGLDTISVLNKELDGYRKQLTDSYIMDKEVIKALTKELYDRKKEDIRLSHILISISKRANAGEIESKRKAALDIFNRISSSGVYVWKKMFENNDKEKVYQVLNSHLISRKAVSILLRDNFTVDDYHTYFVGNTGVLVHNDPCDEWLADGIRRSRNLVNEENAKIYENSAKLVNYFNKHFDKDKVLEVIFVGHHISSTYIADLLDYIDGK